jgi:uncharacterized protein YqgC (DUF456 family)
MQTALWVLAVVLIVIGFAGTLLPALPGPPFIVAGIWLAAWIDDFSRVSALTAAILTALALAATAVDYIAAALGAQRVGASRAALIGAALGTLLGIFTGLIGLLFMPLVGAAIGEFVARRDALRAGQVGIATWIGMLVGTVLKLVLVCLTIGIFVASLLFD